MPLRRFTDHLALLRNSINPHNLDDTRKLLVQAGQLEQGIMDALHCADENTQVTELAASLTDIAAFLFLQSLGTLPTCSPPGTEFLQRFGDRLQELARGAIQGVLRVKIPEGFEFYTLYPEQYVAAAQRWSQAHEHSRGRTVLVVGLRSIGTSLSAVVSSTLRSQGWPVRRVTVRPTGHPYARQVLLPLPGPATLGLVVDEGPGRSGSSMAATEQALRSLGITDIYFLPGHPHGPGEAASAETQACWARTPRYVMGLEDLRWGNASLQQLLQSRSSGEQIHCLSAGKWRGFIDGPQASMPAAPAFERTKFLSVTGGGVPGTLWKFQGLGAVLPGLSTGADVAFERMHRLASLGWTVEPVEANYRGFMAIPWIAGQRLTVADGSSPQFLSHLAAYISQAAGPPLPGDDLEAAVRRLQEMVHWNTRGLEKGDSGPPDTLPCWLPQLRELPAYGDGRLAPHEWVRTPEGKLLKTDCAGHDCDHTLVGSQPVLWDAAGAIVEWHLGPEHCEALIQALAQHRIHLPTQALDFYIKAYAVFRSALMEMSGAHG